MSIYEEPEEKFQELSIDELAKVLGLTIKCDNANKAITFLSMLSVYTENNQFNISYNAPSSSGKSFIPLEIVGLFPKEDVMKIGYASPTSFYHGHSEFIKEKGIYLVDLEGKIILFLEQPHNQLLERIRPVLSHDEKEITLQITDKKQKDGLKTKNIVIRGFPSVIFCTAGLRMDEQEATRFLLLSPDTNSEKLQLSIEQLIDKEADKHAYLKKLDENVGRQMLKARIIAIKNAGITDIKLNDNDRETLKKVFLLRHKRLLPRHQRDIKRLTSIIKAIALLNYWNRKRDGGTLYISTNDIDSGFKLWDIIYKSQELNLPPYVLELFKEVVEPLLKNTSEGITRNDILEEFHKVKGRPLADYQLRRELIPMWETAGLIRQESDPNDKRIRRIHPTVISTLSVEEGVDHVVENNVDSTGGINNVKAKEWREW